MTVDSQLPFDNSYARLPEHFFARLLPTPVARPSLIALNEDLARAIGLSPDYLGTREGIDVLAGNFVPTGAEPIATAYAGFQFGNWVPQLGDGRAILLGEVVDREGVRRDVQLKGAGRTPFSRGGDGRAGIGPVLREYVVSEAMAALGIPTTRALAAVATGETIMRDTALPGAVLTRVAQSHIRVGTFQFFAGRRDVHALRVLSDYAIARHYPAAAGDERPALALLEAVIERQAKLVAGWQLIGFIHGVMNTDNASITGETIDYGPCAFMDTYHPDTVYSSIDRTGRYAYSNQPDIAHWNVMGLAQALLPLLDADEKKAVDLANEALREYPEKFERFYRSGLRRKLGLDTPRAGDDALADELLARMAENHADFTLTFRGLADGASEDTTGSEGATRVRGLFDDPHAFDDWAARWRARLASESPSGEDRRRAMRSVNPAFIPRNHRIEEVIRDAVDGQDLEPFRRLTRVLSTPYDDQPSEERYALPPTPDEVVHATFCGT